MGVQEEGMGVEEEFVLSMSFVKSTTHDFRRITKLSTTGQTYHCILYQAHGELQRKSLALAPQCLLLII